MRLALALVVVLALTARLGAHSGPPFPIVSSQIAGAYDIAIWTDPDATDDAVAGGQFWVVLKPRRRGGDPGGHARDGGHPRARSPRRRS